MATMTAQQVINETRDRLHDTEPLPANQDWLDAFFIRAINSAVKQVVKVRPDCRWNPTGTGILTIADVTAVGDDITIDDHFKEALVLWCMSMCYQSENSDRWDAEKSVDYRKLFAEELKV